MQLILNSITKQVEAFHRKVLQSLNLRANGIKFNIYQQSLIRR